ncbi:hypothetical protein H0H92_014231 [Tricholoma furcatifolium]|nr:hypothetical protein H0H92_014231 [Tricholoma furcatifolium]
MPTATSTLSKVSKSPIKGKIPVTAALPASTTLTTLRPLYNRAARAFLLRDIPLTHSLIESAFAQIPTLDTLPDPLEDQRRKWDILRITLESTVYYSPPPQETLLGSLKEIQLQSPQTLLTTLHGRSLALFTPKWDPSHSNSMYLPTQVLITLIYSSLRLDTPDIGRTMVEDWLSKRDPSIRGPPSETSGGGYGKVLELYCLEILPKLQQWEYAQEFLEYEGELPASYKENLIKSLRTLQTEAMTSRHLQSTEMLSPSHAQSSSPRSGSPAPSTSSSSSSISTTSTHTIVPATRRLSHPTTTLAPSGASSTSLSSDSTATPAHPSRRPVLSSRPANAQSTFSSFSSIPRSPAQSSALRPANLSTFALIKASLAPYMSPTNLSTAFILLVVVPLVSFLLRARHRRRQGLNVTGSTNADLVRQRLLSVKSGALGKTWGEIVRVVCDTVRMAGSGLV